MDIHKIIQWCYQCKQYNSIQIYTKGIWEETLFFLKGQTDVRILQSKNADPEYKKKHNKNLKDYDLGPVYGYQWRK